MAKRHKVVVIPGEGIGPEIMTAILPVIEATGVSIDWKVTSVKDLDRFLAGTTHLDGPSVVLKGPIGTPIGGGVRSYNVRLRERLNTFANIRPSVSLPGTRSRYERIDLVVVRENLEDLYAGYEFSPMSKGAMAIHDADSWFGDLRPLPISAAYALKVITPEGSSRIARAAFEYAEQHGRRKVTIVHKANILKITDGMFLREARAIAQSYPNIEANDCIVDACCMKLVVVDPSQFDVLLCPNLYGDILSDLCAGLVGGLGNAPGANIGFNSSIFEAVHGTAPDIAGRGIANPTAMLLSACMMLDHLKESVAARSIRTALLAVLMEGAHCTGDFHHAHAATTNEMAEVITEKILK